MRIRHTLLPLALAGALVACGDDADDAPSTDASAAADAGGDEAMVATTMAAEPSMAEDTSMTSVAAGDDIVDTAVGAGSFSTLVTAVQAAGLEETLRGEGPFTVFAPTDDAFAALPAGTLDTLLADPTGDLADILTYHVVEGEVLAADVAGMDGQEVTTVNGATLHRQRRRRRRRDVDRRRRQRGRRRRDRCRRQQRRHPRHRRRPAPRVSDGAPGAGHHPPGRRRVLVAGATGFVGSRLVDALVAIGHDVRAMSRRPGSYTGAGRPVAGDVHDRRSLGPALDGAEIAYYLVHSLDDDDFERRDAVAAEGFGAAAAAAGVGQLVYLGGLGAEDPAALSPHLRSRRQVESRLGAAGVPVTVLRAAIVVGDGGVSWEITRQLVKNLPVMVTPRWVETRTQPIAAADAVRYLVGVLDHPEAVGRVFEIGGPDVLTYAEMLRRAARACATGALCVS